MKKALRFSAGLLCCVVGLLFPYPGQAQRRGGQYVRPSIREFVQEFYNWYVPVALEIQQDPAWEIAVQHRSSVFSSELHRLLQEDLKAQARTQDANLGLDFDPFLNSQDICERYQVGRAMQKGTVYRVNVHAVCSGKRSSTPTVVPLLRRKGNFWVFVNFEYEDLLTGHPTRTDLVSLLKLLGEERRKFRK